MEATGIIIVAAGNSSRLGQPKQLLEYNGHTLLRNTILQAQRVPDSFVVVVTGAYKPIMDKELAFTSAKVVHNAHWETGLASSIVIGLHQLRAYKHDIKSCIITVCDQPYLTTEVFKRLTDEYKKTGKGIIASAYSGTMGTPVLFGNTYFKQLQNLTGDEGARKLMQIYKDDVAVIPFEKGAVDIDTIEDYNNLIK